VHAHELRSRPGKIEAGVKILAEEIEIAWREGGQ
jgi:alanine-alpha-ketoisovalerate/valine-pyruvate aminotransferase